MHGGECLRFSFWFMCPRLGALKAGNLEVPMDREREKKNSNKSLFSPAEGQRKENFNKTGKKKKRLH